jgi:hypothetical protein
MPIRLLHISALDETLQMVSSFTLADTNGRPAVAFHSGDSFDCSLVVSNLSDQDQVYHSTGPTVIFEIVQGDSAVATWVDGLAWTQDVRRGVIGRGQAERQGWRGPNTRARTVTLVPGAYTAVARLRYAFSTANVRDPEPIQFSVTR